jgi:flagellar motility protein MotE (MotC chaperone)
MKGAGSILVFVAAFVVVTIIMIVLNSKFNNIFKFDFSPPHSLVVNAKDSANAKNKELENKDGQKPASEVNIPGVKTEEVTKQDKKDSLANSQLKISTNQENGKNNKQEEIAQNTKQEKNNLNSKQEQKTTTPPVKTTVVNSKEQKKNNSPKTVNNNKPVNNNITKNSPAKVDSSYIKWTKNTAAIYEAMDSKKAAKIIQNYSDNIARDIIYAMKKKKAAEILAELTPEVANKITKAK